MTLLLFCMTIMRAPTMPSPDSGGVDGAASGVSITFNRTGRERLNINLCYYKCPNNVAIMTHYSLSVNT